MMSTKNWKEVLSRNFGQFCRCLWMVFKEGVYFSGSVSVHMYKKEIYFF